MKMIVRIITAAATALSFIGLAFSSFFAPWVQILIVCIGLTCFVILVFGEIQSNRSNERICVTKAEVAEAMKDIINSQGEICIMSRDLSWVTPEIMGCLEMKKGGTQVFAQSENDTTRKLVDRGVRVKYYGHLKFEPKSRFTVIGYNKNSPQVVIANTENTIRKKKKFRHTIYQTSANGAPQDIWINSLATDMINLCSAVSKEVEYAKKS